MSEGTRCNPTPPSRSLWSHLIFIHFGLEGSPETWIRILTRSLLALWCWAVTDIFGCRVPARRLRCLISFYAASESPFRVLTRVWVGPLCSLQCREEGRKKVNPCVFEPAQLWLPPSPAKHEDMQDLFRGGKSQAVTRLVSLMAPWAGISQSILFNSSTKACEPSSLVVSAQEWWTHQRRSHLAP